MTTSRRASMRTGASCTGGGGGSVCWPKELANGTSKAAATNRANSRFMMDSSRVESAHHDSNAAELPIGGVIVPGKIAGPAAAEAEFGPRHEGDVAHAAQALVADGDIVHHVEPER